MIGVGPGDRLGAPGLSGSAYDPRFGSTLGTTAYGACIRILTARRRVGNAASRHRRRRAERLQITA